MIIDRKHGHTVGVDPDQLPRTKSPLSAARNHITVVSRGKTGLQLFLHFLVIIVDHDKGGRFAGTATPKSYLVPTVVPPMYQRTVTGNVPKRHHTAKKDEEVCPYLHRCSHIHPPPQLSSEWISTSFVLPSLSLGGPI
ncbi:hypothetical protein RvY_15492 [Ramazzottius varieornatus]|uniref:Uncharacterized protein n=1 Tax=Ramazzottius varieornatus TaxID=947166 RepID=A0A1D1W1X6_RAMVA|nr:hypothetical protein RvY_15492 [Ramazzottius varieornatus]